MEAKPVTMLYVRHAVPRLVERACRVRRTGQLPGVQPIEGLRVAVLRHPRPHAPQGVPRDHAVLVFAQDVLQLLSGARQRRRWSTERRLHRLCGVPKLLGHLADLVEPRIQVARIGRTAGNHRTDLPIHAG